MTAELGPRPSGTSVSQVWLPADAAWKSFGGTPGIAATSNWPLTTFDDTTIEGIARIIVNEHGWTAFDVDVWWMKLTAGTGNVVFRWYSIAAAATQLGDGEALATANTLLDTTAAAPAQAELEVTRIATGQTFESTAMDKMVRLNFARAASDAADTLTGDIGVAGFMLTANP